MRKALQAGKKLHRTSPAGEGPPFLAAETLTALAVAADETAMVKLITPELNRVLFGSAKHNPDIDSNPFLLLISENISWLHHHNERYSDVHWNTPDWYISKAGVVEFQEPSTGQGNKPWYHYGKLASFSLQGVRGVTRLLDAKKERKITDEHFGVAVKYCDQAAPGATRAMIVARDEFLLVRCEGAIPIEAWICANGAAGSGDMIRNFFFQPDPAGSVSLETEPWDEGILAALDYHLSRLGASLVLHNNCAYLGSGASAFVFRIAIHGKVHALKISMGSDAHKLKRESEILVQMASGGAPVIPPVPSSFGKQRCPRGSIISSAYVLEHAGTTFSGEAQEAFHALQALHRAGYVRGDARWPNLIQVACMERMSSTKSRSKAVMVRKHLWIDADPLYNIEDQENFLDCAQDDVVDLVCSFSGLSPGELPPTLQTLCRSYVLEDDNAPLSLSTALAALTLPIQGMPAHMLPTHTPPTEAELAPAAPKLPVHPQVVSGKKRARQPAQYQA
jgi:hypothetical protein